MVANESSFRMGFFEVRKNMHILFGFLWHKQWHLVHFSKKIGHLKKVLIDVIFASIHRSFVLL
jgi:hypothetical protein